MFESDLHHLVCGVLKQGRARVRGCVCSLGEGGGEGGAAQQEGQNHLHALACVQRVHWQEGPGGVWEIGHKECAQWVERCEICDRQTRHPANVTNHCTKGVTRLGKVEFHLVR